MIIALVPTDRRVRYVFLPVLAGAIMVTVFAVLDRLLERLLTARMNRETRTDVD
jgi:hypothetical protein